MKKLVAFVLLVCITFSLWGCSRTQCTESLEDYLQPSVPMIFAEFLLFPVRAELAKCTVNQYRSESVSTLLFDDIYILLSCTYTQSQYDGEIARFEGVGAHYREDLFRCPAYVAVFSPRSYEYVLMDEETLTITYIAAHTTDFDSENPEKTLKNFPTEFAPVKTSDVDIYIYDYDRAEGEIRLNDRKCYSFSEQSPLDKCELNGVPAKTASLSQITSKLEPCELDIPDCGQISAAIEAAYYGASALSRRTPNWTSHESIHVVHNETANVWIVHGLFKDRNDPGEAWAVALDAETGKVLGFAEVSPS